MTNESSDNHVNVEVCNFGLSIEDNVDDLSYCRTMLLELFNDKNSHDLTLISNVDEKR